MAGDNTRRFVRGRAGGRCEYCHLLEGLSEYPFHLEHIVARQHGGDDNPSNLALACDRCNLYKGPNLSSIDPLTGHQVPLFHPRNDDWDAHFAFHGPEVVGRTPTGRASVRLLRMNASRRVAIRTRLLQRGEAL